MPYADHRDRREYMNEYHKKNVRRTHIDMSHSDYEAVAALAAYHGVPVATYIKSLIKDDYYNMDDEFRAAHPYMVG